MYEEREALEAGTRIPLLINGELCSRHQCEIELLNTNQSECITNVSDGGGMFKNGPGKAADGYHAAVLRINSHLPLSAKMTY